MIENEKQYQITLDWIETFKRAAEKAEARMREPREGDAVRIIQACCDGYRSMVASLEEEAAEWRRRNA